MAKRGQLAKRGHLRLVLSRAIDPVRPNEKIGRNFPRLAELVDHVDRERASASENLGCTQVGAENIGEFALRVPQLLDRVVEHIDRIEVPAAIDWPPPCLVTLDQGDEYIELVALLTALWSTPTGVDCSKRCAVIFVGPNGPDIHDCPLQY